MEEQKTKGNERATVGHLDRRSVQRYFDQYRSV